MIEQLADAIEQLPERSRMVLALYYRRNEFERDWRYFGR